MNKHGGERKETAIVNPSVEEKGSETSQESQEGDRKQQARGLSDDIVDSETRDVAIDPAKPRER